jgi:hypothetical protein
MNRLLLVFATALAGCVIVPTTRTTTKSLGTEDSGLIEGATKGIKLTIESPEAQLVVRATYQRDCERQVLAVTQTTTSIHAKLGGSSDPRGRVFGFLISPLTIPISAAITGLVLASSDDQIERKTAIQSVTKLDCTTVAANLPVELVLPSGRTIQKTTDERGMIAMPIPDTEPYQGQVIARAGHATDHTDYTRPRPALAVLRDATRACASRHQLTGVLHLRVTIDTRGAPVRISTDRGPGELTSCLGTAIAKVRFPVLQREATLVFPIQLDG